MQPAGTTAGMSLAPDVTVALQDATGSTMQRASGPVTITLAGAPAGAALLGTTTANAVNGIARFTNLVIQRAAQGYSLIATSGSLSTTSASFAITPGAGSRVGFIVQPQDVGALAKFAPAIQVAVQDAFGNTVPDAQARVTLALGANPGAATLIGPTQDTLIHGIATFPRVRIDEPGTAYTLTASASGFASATTQPFLVTPAPAMTAIAAAAQHTCALVAGGVPYCWGRDDYGQLGVGAYTGTRSAPLPVAGGLTFASVSVGFLHSCGLTSANVAWCWGRNFAGMLGVGDEVHRFEPARVAGDLRFASIAAGGLHGCGITTDGLTYCWGHNEFGAVGDGTTTDRPTPVRVAGDVRFASVMAGDLHNCGLTSEGIAYCWGRNFAGVLGDGTTTDRTIPSAVEGGLRFTMLSPGNAHTCGVATSGTAYCWGLNNAGQLGDGTTTPRLVPAAIQTDVRFATVTTGSSQTCGLTADGVAYCWGGNTTGAVGDGTTTGRSSPVPVAGGLRFVLITAGGLHTCGITVAGAAFCWGADDFGQAGNDQTTSTLTPARVVR